MSDYERYGDYDNTEEDEPKKRTPVGLILRVLIALILIGTVGLLAFRLILFESYPRAASDLVYTEPLAAYYDGVAGEIGAKTQKLRFPYSDAQNGYFFCSRLIVIPGAENLQIALRYNLSTLTALSEEYGVAMDQDSPDLFSFRLADNTGRIYETAAYDGFSSRMIYRYHKLVFDGVDLSDAVKWIRLEIFLAGAEDGEEPVGRVLIYENNEDYAKFTPYRLSRREKR